MKEKILPILYKIAIAVAVLSLYVFIFSDVFDVYDPEWYVICATFLTLIYLKRVFGNK